MRCHDCGDEAIYAPRAGDVRVGLCERHLRERIAEFSDAEALAVLSRAIAD